jgi:hypothetical protein
MTTNDNTALSANPASPEDRDLLNKAQEILELMQRAYKLGYSLTLPPEQMKTVIEIFENGHLIKPSEVSP